MFSENMDTLYCRRRYTWHIKACVLSLMNLTHAWIPFVDEEKGNIWFSLLSHCHIGWGSLSPCLCHCLCWKCYPLASCLEDALLLRKLQQFLESWHPRATSLWNVCREWVAVVMQMRPAELTDRQHACICSSRYDSLPAGRWLNYCMQLMDEEMQWSKHMAKCGGGYMISNFLFRRLIFCHGSYRW
jgi:hypothetical protein